MNVLIIINSFRLGGAEKLCYDLARELSLKREIQVFLFSIGAVKSALENEIFKSFEDSTVKVGSFNKPYKKQRLQTALKIKKFCEINRIDVVHTNGQSPDFLMRFSKILGNKSKTVVTIHSTSGYSKVNEKIFSKYTDAYTAVSKDVLRYLREELGVTRDIQLIDNGIDLQLYSDIHKDKRNEKNFEILSVGRVHPEKDYIKAAQFLAPFLKMHTDVKWIIYGDCTYDTEYYSMVKKEIEKLGISNFVEFKGVNTNPREIYKHGEVFILASSYEGFGIAFIEAIMSNHYVFSRNVGVIQDILKEGGIVHIIDEQKSIKFLEAIYERRVSNSEIAINKQIVVNQYSMNSMVEKYYMVFEGVLR